MMARRPLTFQDTSFNGVRFLWRSPYGLRIITDRRVLLRRPHLTTTAGVITMDYHPAKPDFTLASGDP
jgi:hypothetical protein